METMFHSTKRNYALDTHDNVVEVDVGMTCVVVVKVL